MAMRSTETPPEATDGSGEIRVELASLLSRNNLLRQAEVTGTLALFTGDVRVAGLTETIVAATARAAVAQAINMGAAGTGIVKSAAQVTAEEGRKVAAGAKPLGETILETTRDAAGAVSDFLGGLFSKKKEPSTGEPPAPAEP